MILHAALLAICFQGKIGPVEADWLVKRSNLCVLVKPEKKHRGATVDRVIWGSGLKPGDRIGLKGYVFRDYVGGPDEGNESEFMTYTVEKRSIVFLGTCPKGLSLGPEERFALLPMIAFGGPRRNFDYDYQVPPRPYVGKVLFNSSMKRSRRDSVTLDEMIQELKRIRASQRGRRGHATLRVALPLTPPTSPP